MGSLSHVDDHRPLTLKALNRRHPPGRTNNLEASFGKAVFDTAGTSPVSIVCWTFSRREKDLSTAVTEVRATVLSHGAEGGTFSVAFLSALAE